jgi:hypothetical protein
MFGHFKSPSLLSTLYNSMGSANVTLSFAIFPRTFPARDSSSLPHCFCHADCHNQGRERQPAAEKRSGDNRQNHRQHLVPVEFLDKDFGQPPRQYNTEEYHHTLADKGGQEGRIPLFFTEPVEHDHLPNGEQKPEDNEKDKSKDG